MAKYRTYAFDPVNREKYTGGAGQIILKSSWELEFAKHCDLLPSVLSWGYEMVKIPYHDPLTGDQKVYIPDFFVTVAQLDGYSTNYVFEIKPMSEQLDGFARNSKDAASIARNNAKWMAAAQWCDRHSAEFAVLNETDLFSFHNTRKPRINPIKSFAHTQAKLAKAKTISKTISAKPSVSRLSATVGNRVQKARSRRVGKVPRI